MSKTPAKPVVDPVVTPVVPVVTVAPVVPVVPVVETAIGVVTRQAAEIATLKLSALLVAGKVNLAQLDNAKAMIAAGKDMDSTFEILEANVPVRVGEQSGAQILVDQNKPAPSIQPVLDAITRYFSDGGK